MTFFILEILIGIVAYNMAQAGQAWQSVVIWILLANVALIVVCRKMIAEEWENFRNHRKDWVREKWVNWGQPFTFALILAIVIRAFLFGPYKIPTRSMVPTLMVGDRIFVDKLTYRFTGPDRADVIVFKFPGDPRKNGADTEAMKKDYVKRLVGLPGDEIEIEGGRLTINGVEMSDPPFSKNYYYNQERSLYGKPDQIVKVPDDYFFVLGDNSAESSDSRNWGFVPKDNLIGKARVIWWPPGRVKLIK